MITSEIRSELLYAALEDANGQLREHHALELRVAGQWPPRPSDSPRVLDERPDISLEMHLKGHWIPIDIIYLRQMPQEPEKLKTRAALARDLFEKAVQHLEAMSDPAILISEAGSKYDVRHLTGSPIAFDAAGYLTINSLRVGLPRDDGQFFPIKASDLHSHTIMVFTELPNGSLRLSDDFDAIRTDRREPFHFSPDRIVKIALTQLVPGRQEDARGYEGSYVLATRVVQK